MATKDKELEKLLKDIEQAKTKLGNTLQAINSSKLEHEAKQNELNSLDKQIKQLNKEIDGLETSKKESELNILSSKELYEAQREKLYGENTQLEIKKAELLNIISEKELDIKELDEKYLVRKKEIDNELGATIEELNRTAKSQLKYLEDINNDIVEKINQEAKLKDILDDLTAKIEVKKQEETDQIKVLAGILENKREYDRLVQNISESTKELEVIKAEIISTKKSLLEIQNERNKAEFELREFEKGQSEYIRNKMEIKREREELKGKEEYIKEKYEAAGLKYL